MLRHGARARGGELRLRGTYERTGIHMCAAAQAKAHASVRRAELVAAASRRGLRTGASYWEVD